MWAVIVTPVGGGGQTQFPALGAPNSPIRPPGPCVDLDGLADGAQLPQGNPRTTTMTYDYICTNCGHAWEAEQRISEAPLKDCPSCNQQSAKRQVSGGAGFILKGGGWYSDLYSSPKPAADKSSESSDSKKSETKPPSGDGGAKSSGTKPSTSGGSDGGGGSKGGSKAAKTEAA